MRRSPAYSPAELCQYRSTSPAGQSSQAGAVPMALKLLSEKAYATPFFRSSVSLLRCPAAIDDQSRACHKCRLVRSQVERGIRDLIWSTHASNGLACVELLAHLVLVARGITCGAA